MFPRKHQIRLKPVANAQLKKKILAMNSDVDSEVYGLPRLEESGDSEYLSTQENTQQYLTQYNIQNITKYNFELTKSSSRSPKKDKTQLRKKMLQKTNDFLARSYEKRKTPTPHGQAVKRTPRVGQ